MSKEKDRPLHTPEGKFAPGHKRMGGPKKGNNIHKYRATLLQQLSPFIDRMGSIIAQIDDPGEQVLALSRMMKYAMPSYTAMEYTEKAPRSLTAEEEISKLNAKYHNRPDPTARQDDEEEEE